MEVVILEIAGEGGAVTLVGRHKSDGCGWEFTRQTVDSSMSMLDVEDGGLDPTYVPPPPEWVGTWREAMALLDRYPWALLVPCTVHAAFKDDILVEATRRLVDHPHPIADKRMQAWLAKCR